MARRNDHACGSFQISDGKRQDGCGKNGSRKKSEFPRLDTTVVSDGNAFFALYRFFEIFGKTGSRPRHRTYVHTVGTGAKFTSQTARSEFEFAIKSFVYHVFVARNAFEFFFQVFVVNLFDPLFIISFYVFVKHIFCSFRIVFYHYAEKKSIKAIRPARIFSFFFGLTRPFSCRFYIIGYIVYKIRYKMNFAIDFYLLLCFNGLLYGCKLNL